MSYIDKFQKPPKEFSATAFWFWYGDLKPEKLKWQIDQMVDKGVYNAFMHSRAYLKTPYLEKEWWEAIDSCVERGKEVGFHPWLYDEYAWPSGTAGSTFEYSLQKPSRVLAEGECNMAKGLYVRTYEPDSMASLRDALGQENSAPVAVYILHGKDSELKAIRLDEQEELPHECRVMGFFRQIYPTQVDYLNKDTIHTFLNYTHEEYRKRYGEHFGTLIPGIFFDEIYMAAHPLPWTDKFPEEFFTRCGYDLMSELPFLMEDGGEHGKKVRGDYYKTVAELYEEAFFKQISEWCEKYHLKFTGHTEEGLNGHARRQGNYFNTTRHLQIPGADNHDYRYRFPRKITCCEPKYAVSVARAYNRTRCMSEAMGGAGWGCSLQQFKRGINTMAAMGISMFTLHGFYYECEKQGSQSDWPTSFFYQNPYWKYFKAFADYIGRVCYMNAVGRPVVEVGIFYPIEEMQANTIGGDSNAEATKIDKRFHEALYAMLERQIDTDMIDSTSILRADVSAGRIKVGQQDFRVLVCPNTLTLSHEMIAKLNEFVHAGGKLVFYRCDEKGELPAGMEDGIPCEATNLPKIIDTLFTPDMYVSKGSRADLYISHRITDEKDCYFVSNSSSHMRTLTLQLRSFGAVCKMNPENGKTEPLQSKNIQSGTQVSLTLEADEACYLLFEKEDKTERAVEWEDAGQTAVAGRWSFLPLDTTYDDRYAIDAKQTKLSIPRAVFATELHTGSKQIRICNSLNEDGRCGRHLSLWEGNWITRRPSWQDNCSKENLYFRKKLMLTAEPSQAQLCMVAVNSCTLFVNGEYVDCYESNAQPIEADITKYLHAGENLIAVQVHNDTPLSGDNLCSVEELPTDRMTSLLLQGRVMIDEKWSTFASDKSWIVCDQEQEGWQDPKFDMEKTAKKADASKYQSFGWGIPSGSWLYAWERGNPPMLPWGDYPLFGEKLTFPIKLSYSVTLPAGTVRLKKPQVHGMYTCILDGMPIIWQSDWADVKSDGFTHHLNIQMSAEEREDGLLSNVEVVVDPFDAPLCDWRLHGLQWFSGRVMYRNSIGIPKMEGRYILDLGQVNFSAEVWVNGKLADIRVWAPYRTDITDFIKDGENDIVIIAANSAAVERRNMLVDEGMALGWNRYWNEDNIDREGENLVSGLMGPISIYRQIPR